MHLEPVDLGICHGYDYAGDRDRTAIVLPGRMLAGMPVHAFAIQALTASGCRVVQVWDECLDAAANQTEWSVARLDAARRHAQVDPLVVVGKSMTTYAAGVAADRSWPAVWLTPLLRDASCAEMLRRRTAPALLVGGTEDPMWDSRIARELSEDVLELDGADHGLARAQDMQPIVDAVATFVGRL